MARAKRERGGIDGERLRRMGRALKARRVMSGLTTEEAGAGAGISHGSVSRIEAGQVDVPFLTLERLAVAVASSAHQILADAASIQPPLAVGRRRAS